MTTNTEDKVTRKWRLKLWDGNRQSTREFFAECYINACHHVGTWGFPPAYIWSIEEVE